MVDVARDLAKREMSESKSDCQSLTLTRFSLVENLTTSNDSLTFDLHPLCCRTYGDDDMHKQPLPLLYIE